MMASSQWNTHMMDDLCNEVLSQIELYESRLLNWGFVDVRSDLNAELPTLLRTLSPAGRTLWEHAQQQGVQISALLTNLLDRKLLFQSPNAGRAMYVSRFASAVRLFFLLRQRFSPNDWQTASRLVSDMRLSLQRRTFPKRTHAAAELLQQLESMSVGRIHRDAIQRLLEDQNGEPISLARFQRDAIIQQVRNLQGTQDRALVIGAGTGAGKTKAFYIPALAEIAMTISSDFFVKVLAIYPRVELLKDQLQEAFSESRKLDSLLSRKRSICIGAYYGDTPTHAGQLLYSSYRQWAATASKDGWICPFFRCPNQHCANGQMVWSRRDVEAEQEGNKQQRYGTYARLRCDICSTEVGAETLMLTREQMIRQPPDIVLTTTEMLNRRLSRTHEHALFGVGTPQPPRLMLLDEIHTYEGLTGAQVAYLLRRWRHARGSMRGQSLCIIGLSATLTQAEHFFAQLTGIPQHNVGYIFPQDRDLVEEGMEYNLILKGDPVSSTSLLSTSVQAAMLLGRILDSGRRGSPTVSKGALGWKTFAFTDKLDVINRWYHIEQDAEQQKVLAKYRRVDSDPTSDVRLRHQLGQIWQVCEDIGHDLRSPLRLDLTSSQYRGVDSKAELVIATSTLEVGLNDPEVGAVLQHKAPRSMASFLQRKGRAGRRREMRPWTVVVTSAYGRDRWAFQHAEQLFAPTLPPIELPLENSYVRKIQATFALMDWLACELKQSTSRADVWQALTNKGTQTRDLTSSPIHSTRRNIKSILTAVLEGSRVQNLKAYLRQALGVVDARGLDLILWGEPRPLLTEVIPTILRRLDTDWQRIEHGIATPWGDAISQHPLPDFIPANLFTDLNLPELTIHLPESRPPRRRTATSNTPQMRDDVMMPMGQAMSEFAPGHVTKRFAHKDHIDEAHWLALPDEAQLSRGVLPLEYLNIERDAVPIRLIIDNESYALYRPYAYTTAITPAEVKTTSTGRLIWRSYFAAHSRASTMPHDSAAGGAEDRRGMQIHLAPSSVWRTVFATVDAYLHSNGTWMEVSRLAVGVNVDTRYTNGQNRRRTLMFEEDGNKAALGFTISTDALCFQLRPFDVQTLISSPRWPEIYRSLSASYALHHLSNDVRLHEVGLSQFEIGWLWQLEVSMLVATAVARQCSLAEAFNELQDKRVRVADRTLNVIFQSISVDDDEDNDLRGRLHSRLMEYIADPLVEAALNATTPLLWGSALADLKTWLHDVYRSSVGSTLFTALTRLVPDIDPNELILDVEGDTIWISEGTAGGIGLVEKIVTELNREPHTFDLQMLDTLQHCDTQALADHLERIGQLLDAGTPTLNHAFATIRTTRDIPTLNATRQKLAVVLEDHGVPASRELLVSINTKYLRPNSGTDTDTLVGTVVQQWRDEEQRLGICIDLRVLAVTAPKIPIVDAALQSVLKRIGGVGARADEAQAFNLLQSLLWIDCHDSCPNCIQRPQLYQEVVLPSRALLLTALDLHQPPRIRYGEEHWFEGAQQQLEQSYRVDIICTQHQRSDCHTALLEMLATAVDVGSQLFYPAVVQIRRNGMEWTITLAISELV